MKKFLLALILIMFFCSNAIKSDMQINTFILEQKTDSFEIVTEKGKIGKIINFKMFDNKNILQAYLKKEVYIGITKVTFFDENNNKIGFLEETVISNVFSPYALYKIYDKNYKLFAISDKIQLGQTSLFHINDLSGNLICTFNKPKVSLLSANWKLEIVDNNVDKRIFLLIPAYKTTRD
jgi:hypothetical protein